MIEDGVNERMMMARKGEEGRIRNGTRRKRKRVGKRKTTSRIRRRISNEHFRQDTIELGEGKRGGRKFPCFSIESLGSRLVSNSENRERNSLLMHYRKSDNVYRINDSLQRRNGSIHGRKRNDAWGRKIVRVIVSPR